MRFARVLIPVAATFGLSNCVAYMEHKARTEGLTGDPTQGGYYGFSEELSNQRIAGMDNERKAAAGTLASKQSQRASLKQQVAAAEARRNAAVTAEAKAQAEKELKRLRRQLLIAESAS